MASFYEADRKKSWGVKSGEKGGWAMTDVSYLTKKSGANYCKLLKERVCLGQCKRKLETKRLKSNYLLKLKLYNFYDFQQI